MSANTCGCTGKTCGCCEGTEALVPAPLYNRPGLDALTYRVGTHGSFLETMKARLGGLGLTTRDSSDPAIALLDAWSSVGDVLTFYQERIANEGFLRTATERRSVLELARLVGYSLRPGVAASVYLAYTLEDKQLVPVSIPVGARSQSIPGPGQLPQFFETSDKLEARHEWNNLQVRLHNPQTITLLDAHQAKQLYLAGVATNLKPGDSLMLEFAQSGQPVYVVRKIATVEGQFADARTLVHFQPMPVLMAVLIDALRQFISAVLTLTGNPKHQAILEAEEFLAQALLGAQVDVARVEGALSQFDGGATTGNPALAPAVKALKDALGVTPPAPAGPVLTTQAQLVTKLLIPAVEQFRSTFQLPRSLGASFKPASDIHPALLIRFAPQLRDTLYSALANAAVSLVNSDLKAVYVFRLQLSLFGASVPNIPAYTTDHELKAQNLWTPWTLSESKTDMFLDQAHDAISPSSPILIENDGSRSVNKPQSANTVQHNAYGISGKATHLTFAEPWRQDETNLDDIRQVLVYAQSEALELADEPRIELAKGTEIELDGLYDSLTSGRWIILTGERADIDGVAGVTGTELLMISGLRQQPTIPGDTTHTTLELATSTAYRYKCNDKLKIYGNVVKATHGETKNETLGSGDGSQELQSFSIKQPPLTFVSSSAPSGIDSTLQVFVNNVEWHEADTLAGLNPKARNFVTQTDDKDITTVIFGNGVEGARLPTGVQNVVGVYRSGIGQPGNVDAEQISMLVSRPLGVKAVLNPLRASGGADREDIINARANTPLAMMALDRLVSVEDYGYFARTYAGIGKASARRLSNGREQLVHVTIAGADDVPIDPTSDLYRNLLDAFGKYGGASIGVQLAVRELKILVTSVKIKIDPDYWWDDVAAAARAAILDTFGFANRSLSQPALLCELIGAVQNVKGVIYVDVDALGGIPERVPDANGNRILITADQIARQVAVITGAFSTTQFVRPPSLKALARVDANQAGLELGVMRPAQLAMFIPDVQDTIVLNQIL